MSKIETRSPYLDLAKKIDRHNERIIEHGQSEMAYVSKTIANQLYNHKKRKFFDFGSGRK